MLRFGQFRKVEGRCCSVMEPGDLQGRQGAVEDLDLVDQSVLEPAIPEPLADGDLVVAAAGDVLGQMVADDRAVGAPAVDIERQPVGAAGSVVGDRDVGPPVDRHRLPGTDADGVARPEVDEPDAELAILDQELITAAARVGPGHRAMKDHRAVLVVGRLDPQGQRERVGAVEVAQGERHVVLAAELERPAHAPLDHLGILRSLAGLRGIGPVDDLAPLEGLEREVADHPGQLDLVANLGPAQPRLECGSPTFGHPAQVRLGCPDPRLDRRDATILDVGGQQERRGRDGVGEVRIQARLVDVREEAEELIILFLSDRIIFMTVASGALEGQAEEGGREGVGPVGDVLDAELLLDAAPLVGLAMVAVEGRGEDLVRVGAGSRSPASCQVMNRS